MRTARLAGVIPSTSRSRSSRRTSDALSLPVSSSASAYATCAFDGASRRACSRIAARLQVREAEIGVAEWIVRGEIDQLLELRFRLGKLIALEVAEAEHPRREELLDGRRLLATLPGREQDHRAGDVPPVGHDFHVC
jgi:hypothetical protein